MITIAIDGPASSGKSSVGARVAQQLGYAFLDTGLLYRAVTAAALVEGSERDLQRLVDLAQSTRVVFSGETAEIEVGGVRSTVRELESAQVERAVPLVAARAEVRSALRDVQRAVAQAGNAVLAGRDIGTVVLPEATLKFFLDATPTSRAERRARQRGYTIGSPEHLSIVADLTARDESDRGRAVAPLVVANDALVINTDAHTLDEVVDLLVATIRATHD